MNGPWEVRNVPEPKPGPGQILVKMHASGVCYTDVHETLGNLPGTFPRILGHEPVGEVVAVGPGVHTRKVGDRVGVAWTQGSCGRCESCQRGLEHFCQVKPAVTSIQLQGGHAEFMPMYAEACTLLPRRHLLSTGGADFLRGLDCYSGLRWANPKPHERVAVLGIEGKARFRAVLTM